MRTLLGIALLTFPLISPTGAGDLAPPGSPEASMMTLVELGDLVAATQASTEAATIAALTDLVSRGGIRQADLPLTISESGSYFLAENLTGTSGQSGITISVDEVSLDLNGFTLQGVPGSLSGITIAPLATPRNLLVFGGTIADWGASGVNFTSADNCIFSDLQVRGCESDGLITGDNAIVSKCVVTGCVSGSGIVTGVGSVVTECVARGNGSLGFELGASNVVDLCTVRLNSAGGLVTGLSATVNRSVITDNSGDGVNLGNGSLIRDCTVNANGYFGIGAEEGCLVVNNISSFNDNTGIIVGSHCRVEGNVCDSNGQTVANGAGLELNTDGNVALGNHLSRNDVGLRVLNVQNYTSRNALTGNTVSVELNGSVEGPGDLANIIF